MESEDDREVSTMAAETDTREQVQRSIMQHGPSTAAELAERLDLTPAGIRRHLTGLCEAGLIQARDPRVHGARRRGRPAKVFELTPAGRESFHQAYDDLAIQALAHLAESAGDSAVEELARARVSDVADRYERLRADEPDAHPAEVLARALSADGYVASTRPARHGVQICQHHCPVAHVAERFPQLCTAETELFSQLLDVHVQRLATIAHGDGVCTTHVPIPRPATDRPDHSDQEA